jgi:cytochrome c-type biogenesis protein CcmE
MWDREQPSAYDPDANRFTFMMRDDEGTLRQVVYAAPKPASFEDAEKVVVEGRMEGDTFVADGILVKCPSKYNDAREFESADAGAEATTQPVAAR